MMLKFWRLFLIIMIPAVTFSFLGENVSGYAFIAVFLVVTGVEFYLYPTKKNSDTDNKQF